MGSQVEEEKSILKLWVLFVLSVDIILWEMGGMGETSGDTAGFVASQFFSLHDSDCFLLGDTNSARPTSKTHIPSSCLLQSITQIYLHIFLIF